MGAWYCIACRVLATQRRDNAISVHHHRHLASRTNFSRTGEVFRFSRASRRCCEQACMDVVHGQPKQHYQSCCEARALLSSAPYVGILVLASMPNSMHTCRIDLICDSHSTIHLFRTDFSTVFDLKSLRCQTLGVTREQAGTADVAELEVQHQDALEACVISHCSAFARPCGLSSGDRARPS